MVDGADGGLGWGGLCTMELQSRESAGQGAAPGRRRGGLCQAPSESMLRCAFRSL